MRTESQLTPEEFRWINAVLLNDEYSSDEELAAIFQKELVVSKELADKIVSFRTRALCDMCFDVEAQLEFAN